MFSDKGLPVWQYNGKPMDWTRIGSPGSMFAAIYYGDLYGLNPDGTDIFHWSPFMHQWNPVMNSPSPAMAIAVGRGFTSQESEKQFDGSTTVYTGGHGGLVRMTTDEAARVSVGDPITLSWSTTGCDNNRCQIDIGGADGLGRPIYSRGGLGARGSLSMTPIQDTRFTISARSPDGQDSQSLWVTLAPRPEGDGVSRVVIVNSHTEGRSVNVWTIDHNTGNSEDNGSLQPGGSKSITLESGHTFDIVCVDEGAIGCTGNDPNILSCRGLFVPNLVGNNNGRIVQMVVS